MCGISALFTSDCAFQASLIKEMSDQIVHRGPDDEGYFLQNKQEANGSVYGGVHTPKNVFNNPFSYCPKDHIDNVKHLACTAALGHRRLSILDLTAAGHQPMCTPDQSLWITYNGEIYNYIEVRQQLIQEGYCFHTQSDTEVILQAYRAWGVDCLQHFNGMFAFVIYDTKRSTVFAARDRFGVKPLYYWRTAQGILAFASEIKQFTILPGWGAQLNAQRAYDFLNWGLTNHTAETMFKGVQQLRGGEYLLFSLKNASKSTINPLRWYSVKPHPFSGSFHEAGEKFRDLLEDSIRLRLRADVAIGSCLSGGLDSSSIVCLVNRLLKNEGMDRQKTFSACSPYSRFDEKQHIDCIIAKTGVEAHFTYPTVEQLMEDAAKVLWHQDEPYPTTSIYAQWQVFKLAKEQGVKVMLDGQGADEQLGGYQGFFGNRAYDLFCGGRWSELCREVKAVKQMHPHLKPWPLLLNKLVPNTFRQPLRRLLGRSSTGPKWLDFHRLKAKDKHPCSVNEHSILKQSIQQLTQTSVPMLLHFEDRDSMAHSIESRTPFLDYRLVEFNLGLMSGYKVSEGWTKHVMRKGMENVLPPSICWRVDKMGFITAEEEWVRAEQPALFTRLIDESMVLSKGVFNQHMAEISRQMITGQRPYHSVLWRQITFAHWLDLFKVSI